MTGLATAAEDYLRTRRALGYQLICHGRLLGQFVDYLDAHNAERITVAHAVAWARLPTSADPAWWNERLSIVRGFARYVTAFDPATEVPPTGLLPSGRRRRTPYLFSDKDIDALLGAAGGLTAGLRADTYQTLIALLAVTGMRTGEAVGLDRADIDSEHGLITIRNTKFGKHRQIPVHASTIDALDTYAQRTGRRSNHLCTQNGPSFFVSTTGTRLIPSRVSALFGTLVRDIGLSHNTTGRPPCAHDLRHSFAVRTLLGWYRDGLDVHQRLPLLSTYLGHVGPHSTYWYLHAAPELMALAAQRLDEHQADRR